MKKRSPNSLDKRAARWIASAMAYASGGKTGVGFDVHDAHSDAAEQERPFYDTELHARLTKVHAALLKGRLP